MVQSSPRLAIKTWQSKFTYGANATTVPSSPQRGHPSSPSGPPCPIHSSAEADFCEMNGKPRMLETSPSLETVQSQGLSPPTLNHRCMASEATFAPYRPARYSAHCQLPPGSPSPQAAVLHSGPGTDRQTAETESSAPARHCAHLRPAHTRPPLPHNGVDRAARLPAQNRQVPAEEKRNSRQ